MEVVTSLVIWVGLALVCMVMAENRGRNKTLGIVAGLLFGIFGVLYYWVAGDTQEMKVEKMALMMDRVDSKRKTK